MDISSHVVLLSRIQFALTTVYHFLFVPLTIGLVWFVAGMEVAYYRTKRDRYKKLAVFFGKIFVINFAIGVVTGIVQEFQFGMNWSEYSRFVGDIFGAPLAIEALLAFFLESSFIGVWLWGRNYVSHKVYVISIVLVAIGTCLSAFWILVANSWMQHPVGYEIVNGKANLVDFKAIISNPYFWRQFPHLILASHATVAFVVLGISAYRLLKNKKDEYFKTALKVAIVWGFIATVLLGIAGHSQAQFLVKTSPMKMAAEALWNTKDPAPFTLFGVFDTKKRESSYTVEIPALLSLLSYDKPTGAVQGINQLEKKLIQKHGQGDYVPPVYATFYGFKIMVIIGTLMPLILIILLFYIYRKKEIPEALLKLTFYSIPLPFIANTGGWILTEIGRFPWVVKGVMTMQQGASHLSSTDLILSIVFYVAIYSVGAIIMLSLMSKVVKKGIIEE